MTLLQRQSSFHLALCSCSKLIVTTSLAILLCTQLTQGKGPPGTPPISSVEFISTSTSSASPISTTPRSITELVLSDMIKEASSVYDDITMNDSPAVKLPPMLGTPASLTGPSGEGTDLSIETNYVPACHNFSVGNPERMEFYSPNYPNNYANHTDCIKVLRAGPGHLLRLDFRDEFNVEPSEDCRYDYLEVRDGAHGYSTLIGSYCGHRFPPMLTSSDRYLWLRFHSDENIEYTGFRAVYQFIPRPTSAVYQPEINMCRIDVGGGEGWVNRSDIDESRVRHSVMYGVPLDCMWVIRVTEGWKIQLSFLKFKLEKPNDCDNNFVDVFSSQTDLPNRLKNFCGSIADSVTSNSNILHVRFLAEAKAINSTFEALFTAFRDKVPGQGCASDEYDCEDNTCISRDLRCNGRINCRFRWDEDECISKKNSLINSEHIIIILVIFTLILSGMCFAFVFNCVRKLIRDHHIMKEHIRQSREGRLDEMGRADGPATLQTAVSLGVLPGGGGSSSGSSPRGLKLRAAMAAMTRYSSEPPRSRDSPEDDDPAKGCYVPAAAGDGGALPPGLLDKPRYNGDAVFLRDDHIVHSPSIEMRDSECQTRDSLFQDIIPPPPPAPRYAHPPRVPSSQMGSNPRFSTFGRSASTAPLKEFSRPEEIEPPHRFRAEAVIEMPQQNANTGTMGRSGGGGGGHGRPYSSAESTKSAPDVIVTH